MNKFKLSASAAALALLIAGSASAVKAADVIEDPGCTLSGAVGIGYMFTWADLEFDTGGEDKDDFDGDWNTPFGEAGGLLTCGAFNIQADFAYYDHTTEISDIGKDVDINGSNSHFGAVAFWRDPSWAALGLSASVVGSDLQGIIQVDRYRFGVVGEWYAGDMFTLGGQVHYFAGEIVDELDHEGWEFTAYGRFYATPDLSLMIQGDYLSSELDIDGVDVDLDLDGWAVTGEAEYLVWDQGLSIFAGARYAEREFEVEDEDFAIDIDDTQVYAGIKFYFGHDGTLIERQRTGLIDNTSTMLEKLPGFINDILATVGD